MELSLPAECAPTLAVGADSANTVCCAIGRRAHVSGQCGDLAYEDNYRVFRRNVMKMLAKLGRKPEIIACDLHPGYFSTRYAETLAGEQGSRLVRVQHHRAHCAAAAAEHGLSSYVGIACDGLGYGDDGRLWGGEVFYGLDRVGGLEEQPMLGGDSATKNPRKMLFGILAGFQDKADLEAMFGPETAFHLEQLRQGYNVFRTSSAGRVLDAAAALLGLETPTAVMLEKVSRPHGLGLEPVIDGSRLLTTPLFRYLVGNLDKDRGLLAATAQLYIAEGLCRIAARHPGPRVFSGGVAFNRIICGYLGERGFLLHSRLLPGDASVSVGQAYLAGALLLKKRGKGKG